MMGAFIQVNAELVDGCSVCDWCRKVQAAQQKFLYDLYAPLTQRTS